MTAHALAKALLLEPDVPVIVTDDMGSFEVSELCLLKTSFHGANDTAKVKRDRLGYQVARPCVGFKPCDLAPPSARELRDEAKARRKMARDRKRMTKEKFDFCYPTFQAMTPAMFTSEEVAFAEDLAVFHKSIGKRKK